MQDLTPSCPTGRAETSARRAASGSRAGLRCAVSGSGPPARVGPPRRSRWRLLDDLENAEPARLRELLRQAVERIELSFTVRQQDKRQKYDATSGHVHFRELSGFVGRGEWIHACKTSEPTTCSFDYSGWLTEGNHLVNVAYRMGKKLQWNAKEFKATGAPEAGPFIRREYRTGWKRV